MKGNPCFPPFTFTYLLISSRYISEDNIYCLLKSPHCMHTRPFITGMGYKCHNQRKSRGCSTLIIIGSSCCDGFNSFVPVLSQSSKERAWHVKNVSSLLAPHEDMYMMHVVINPLTLSAPIALSTRQLLGRTPT